MLAANGDVVWQRDGVVEDRNPATGALVSSFSTGDTLQAMDSAGNLYFSAANEILKTTATGQTLWQYTRNYMDWPLTVDAADDVYCGDQEGDVIALSSSGTEDWEIHLSNNYPDLFNTAPVLGPGGEVFVEELSDRTVTALVPVPEPRSLVTISFVLLLSVQLTGRSRGRRLAAVAAASASFNRTVECPGRCLMRC